MSEESEKSQIDVYHMGVVTGPTADAQAAAPWAAGGFILILSAFVLCFAATIFLAIKRRVPGRRLILSGLTLVMVYFLFQNTLAQDAELSYGPVADALAFLAYGVGGIISAVGYARLVWHVCKQGGER